MSKLVIATMVLAAIEAIGLILTRFIYNRAPIMDEPKQEPHIEPLPALPRYVQEVCEILRELEDRERQADNL